MRGFANRRDVVVSGLLACTLASCGKSSVGVAPSGSVTVTPATATLVVRTTLQLAATVKDAAGDVLSGTAVSWTSSRPAVAVVNSTGLVTALLADTVTVSAASAGQSGAASLTISPSDLPIRGLYVQFERRGWASEYWSGQVLQRFDSVDAVVGTLVSAEVGLQLDVMHGFGVNTISFELRTADSVYVNDGFTPPTCNIPPVLGLRWPQPTPHELANLVAFFDLVQSKGMRVLLRLVNTHMEEQPPANSGAWLGAILGALHNHPALELVLFEGAPHVIHTSSGDVCGIPAEPPLWEGPTSVAGQYVGWAIGYGRSLGLPTRQLSAEAIIGDYFTLSGGGGNLTDPLVVEKGIFDGLQIPDGERTYAVSFYEHRKCSTARGLPCVDLDPDQWADSTLAHVFTVIGLGSRARVIAPEMGYAPLDPSWSTVQAFESLVTRLRRRGMEGGAFWRWVSFMNSEDSDPTLADPVKRRGVSFTYNPVKDALVRLYQAP